MHLDCGYGSKNPPKFKSICTLFLPFLPSSFCPFSFFFFQFLMKKNQKKKKTEKNKIEGVKALTVMR